ncbi:MAG: hypothetical protein ABSF99_09665 [Anaerolineales bacterium]|jgi:hypothetical protein
MLNKYFLFGFLVIIGALAISAFTFVSQKPVQNKLVSIVETGFRTPLTSDYAPAIAEIGFKTPQTSDYAPAIAEIGFKTPQTSDYAPAIAVTGFRTPQSSNYVESISEVASHKILYYEYGPLSAATGSAAMTSFRTPQTSNYVESISPIVQLAASQVGLSKALVTVDKGERDFISLSSGLAASQVGLSKALVTVDKGERDFISLSSGLSGVVASEVGKFRSLAIGNTASVSPFPYIFSPYLEVVPQYVDDHYPVLDTFSLSSVVVGAASDEPYLSPWPTTSSPSLVSVGTASDEPYLSPWPTISSPYLVVIPQYVDDHFPVLSSSYLNVVSTYHDR